MSTDFGLDRWKRCATKCSVIFSARSYTPRYFPSMQHDDLFVRLHHDRAVGWQACVALLEERCDEIVADAAVGRVLCARAKDQGLVALTLAVLKKRIVEHGIAVSAARDQREPLLLAKARKLTLNLDDAVSPLYSVFPAVSI